MLLGYDVERPKKKNYVDFRDRLVSGLSNVDLDGLSLMLYGSYVRGDYVPGRSDIDGVLVFPDDVVIDKEKLMECSNALEEALRENHVPIQISVTDLTTSQDGRFNSYGDDFEEYFMEEADILMGPDYRNQMTYLSAKPGVLHTSSFNLRKSRNGLFRAVYDREHDFQA